MKINLSRKQVEFLELIEDPQITELLIGGSAAGPLPLDSLVLTPFGFKPMGEIKIGDQINNISGGVSRVIDIPYEGNRPCYEIVFSDGSKVHCAENHLWKYGLARRCRRKHLPNEQIGTTLTLKKKMDKYHVLIPLCKPVAFTKLSKKKIDPYVLGVILGDGGFSAGSITLTNPDDEIIEKCRKLFKGEIHKHKAQYRYGFIDDGLFKTELKRYGLLGKKSHEKYIPDEYKYAPIEDRWQLIQGLFDTDGTVDARGHTSYSTTSEQLAKDVQFMARSLGANATITKNPAGYKKDGKYIPCKECYKVYIQHEHKDWFFSLKRKKERAKKPYDGDAIPRKRIISIEPIGNLPVKCISTSALDGLFITDDFVVTHNSKSLSIGLAVALLARKYPGARFFVGRRTLKSLKQSTINTLLSKVHPLLGIGYNDYHFSSQAMELKYKNGSLVLFGELEYLPSDEDYARLGSLEVDCAFVDEAGEITLRAKNMIKSRVGRGVMNEQYGIPGFICLACNPSTNFLRNEYYEPYVKLGGGDFQKWEIGQIEINGEQKSSYRGFLRMGAYDNPFIPQSYIDNLKSLPDRERKRLLDGDWNYADDENSLFRNGLLDKAMEYEYPESNGDDIYIGVDVSDVGKDHSIFSLLINGVLVEQRVSTVQLTWDKNSKLPLGRMLADELVQFAQQHGIVQSMANHIGVEVNGVGGSLRDFLRERGWQISEYTATSKSRSDNYYQLMLDMDYGKVKIYHELHGLDDLRKQLLVHTYEMNNQAPVVLKKEKIKQRLGHSPDEADSFQIANWVRKLCTNPEANPKTNANRILF